MSLVCSNWNPCRISLFQLKSMQIYYNIVSIVNNCSTGNMQRDVNSYASHCVGLQCIYNNFLLQRISKSPWSLASNRTSSYYYLTTLMRMWSFFDALAQKESYKIASSFGLGYWLRSNYESGKNSFVLIFWKSDLAKRNVLVVYKTYSNTFFAKKSLDDLSDWYMKTC